MDYIGYYRNYTNLNMYTAHQIRALREARNLKQATVAKALGISRQAYGKIECCQTRITLDMLEQICDILQVRVSVVLPSVNSDAPYLSECRLCDTPVKSPAPIHDTLNTQALLKLIYGFASLAPDEQLMMLEYLEHHLG